MKLSSISLTSHSSVYHNVGFWEKSWGEGWVSAQKVVFSFSMQYWGRTVRKVSLCLMIIPLANTDLKHKVGKVPTCFRTMRGVADGGVVSEPDCSCPISCPCAFQLLFFICYKNAIILTSNAVPQIF